MTILDIGASKDIAPVLKEILQKRILNSGKELRKHKRKDGSLIDVEVTRRELLFNGCISDIVTAVDVTGYLRITSSHPKRIARLKWGDSRPSLRRSVITPEE